MPGDFLDSNVLLYLFEMNDLVKRETARNVLQSAVSGSGATISFQVVQEVLNGITRRSSPPADPEDAHRLLQETLLPLWRVMPSEALYSRAIGVWSRYRYSFYDSLIIAAALAASCTRLLSENLQDGQRIEGLVIENPFR